MSPRRPERRSEEAAQAVVQAALELCREVGYGKLSIEGIAARAGVGKNTIYRWWPSKGAILLDGLLSAVSVDASMTDTGDIVADLKTQMIAATAALGDTPLGAQYRALIGEAQHNPDLARALLDRFIEPLRTASALRIELAQRKGQVRPDLDSELLVEMLYGPLYYRMLLTHRLPAPARIETLVDAAFAGIAAQPAS